MGRQPYEFEIVVENVRKPIPVDEDIRVDICKLPPCVLQLKHDKRWQMMKDVLRSSIEEKPDHPAEVTAYGDILLCGLRVAKHAKEAYGKTLSLAKIASDNVM